MGWAPLLISGVGMGLNALSTWKAGNQAEQAGLAEQKAKESQAGLYDLNAKIAETQAKDTLAAGQIEESRFRQGTRALISTQRTQFAGGNVDVGYGSAVDVQADTAYMGELDALAIRTNATRAAWGYQVQAVDLQKRAAITRQEGAQAVEAGRQEKKAGHLKAITGGILGGATLLAQSPLADKMGINRVPTTSTSGTGSSFAITTPGSPGAGLTAATRGKTMEAQP